MDFIKQKVAESGTQSAVARKTRVSHGTINKILNGDTKPELGTILKIARAYGVDLSEFEEASYSPPSASGLDVRNQKPHRISEQLTEYSEDLKMIHDSIEIQVQGKTAEERAEFVKGVMAAIWGQGK